MTGRSQKLVEEANALSGDGENLVRKLRLYTDAIKIDDQNHKAHYGIAKVLEAIGRRDRALSHLRKAARIRPDSRKVSLLLVTLAQKDGEEEGGGEEDWWKGE